MRVALDARSLQDRPRGGVGRVLSNVIPRLTADVDLTILYDHRRPPGAFAGTVIRSGLPSQAAWLQVAAPRWLRSFSGVFHCPFYALPFVQPVPMVVSLWDLTFEFRPEWFSPAKRIAFRTQARHAAKTARSILVASEVVRRDVSERYEVEPARIVVAPLGVDSSFHPRPSDVVLPVLSRLSIQLPYVVAFAGAPRRRVDLAIAAWRRAGGRRLCNLVLVGHRIGAGLVEDGIVAVEGIDDDDLPIVMAGASALVYPTEYEGFGLPALEAQASGVPVICARVGALTETLGGVAAWSESLEPDDLAEALTRTLGSVVDRERLVKSGLASARTRPGWAEAAQAFESAYRSAGAG